MNVKKTKILNSTDPNNRIGDNEGEIEEVHQFTYLGLILDGKRGSKADIQGKNSEAQHILNSLEGIWLASDITKAT